MSTAEAKQGSGAFFGIPAFWKAQMKDWRTTVVRTSLDRLGYNIIYPYLSLYIIALGASKAQLGIITSIGMLMSGLLGPITGKFIDQQGYKKVYLIGIAFLMAAYFTYAFAQSWVWCILAMMLYYVGAGTAGHCCGTICGNCLKNSDRGKGMLICESLAAGFLGIVGPQIAIFVLVNLVHCDTSAATAHDYHYLFFIPAFLSILAFFVVQKNLSNDRRIAAPRQSYSQVLKEGFGLIRSSRLLQRWVIVAAIGTATQAMILPYIQVFASEVKGASVQTLGTMVTAQAVTSTVCGYFVGAISDKVGRKKVLYVIWPLYWLSLILLMTSKSSATLILAGVLQCFYYFVLTLSAALTLDLVSPEVMGMWLGVERLIGMTISAILAIVAGTVYDTLGPYVLFIGFICLEAFVRMPLLAKMPETLHMNAGEKAE